MKRQPRYLTIPLNIWTHPDLTPSEKMVLIDIDSYCSDDSGVEVGAQVIASSCGLSTQEVKTALKSLYEKSAITVEIDENGTKAIIPHLYRERYVADHKKTPIFERKKNVEVIDYGYIQEQWNDTCSTLAKIERFTPRRKQKTRSCIQGCGVTVKELITAFKLISTSGFLNGSKTEWSASFDWLVKSPDNLQKVLEGNYHKSDYNERMAYDSIVKGGDAKKQQSPDSFYK